MNILELIEKSHSLAKDKGFWAKEKNPKEDIMLIISNLGEIVKAHKKNKFADWLLYNDQMFKDRERTLIHSTEYFNVFIKDTFEDEIANIVIRITDFFGGHNINILSGKEWLRNSTTVSLVDFFRSTMPLQKYCGNVGEWLEESLHERFYHSKESDHGLLNILFYLGTIIEEFHVDIERQVVAKLEYNSKRPVKYGHII